MVIVKYYNLYVPLNQSSNSYRHYGIKHNKLLFFELHEILHIINSDCKKEYPVYIKPYFQMKQFYNLLRPENYDLKHILKINKFLYNEMSLNCKNWIDKFVDKNVHIIKWEDINEQYINSLNLKERKMFQVMYSKLKSNEKLFKINSDSDFDKPLVKQKTNFSKKLSKFKTKLNLVVSANKLNLKLFNIKECFDDFNIPGIKILNNLNYLKQETQNNNEINLLDLLYFDVYKTKSDFNRNKDSCINKICFINKYVKLKNMIDMLNNKLVCVISNQEYVILKINKITYLQKNLDEKLIKKRIN